MSLSILQLVLSNSHAHGTGRMVLLVLAHHADDAGLSWPSIGTLARESNLDRRNVQRRLRELVAAGELRIEPLNKRASHYRITCPTAAVAPPPDEHEQRRPRRPPVAVAPPLTAAEAPPPCGGSAALMNYQGTEIGTVSELRGAKAPQRTDLVEPIDTPDFLAPRGNKQTHPRKRNGKPTVGRMTPAEYAAWFDLELAELREPNRLAEIHGEFPGVDVIAEMRKARAWALELEPRARKQRPRQFVMGWLGRAHPTLQQNRPTAASSEPDDLKKAW